MSIIQTIRDKGSWVMFVLLALALISFIFMDAGRRDSIFGGGGGNRTIGTVNGSRLKTETFAERVDALRKIYAENQQVTEEQIQNFVWSSMVTEKLMKSELNGIGFKMSEKDLVDFALGKYGQPNQHVIPFFNHYFKGAGIVDEQTGQLNQPMAERAYRQALRRPTGQNDEAVSVFKTLLGMVRDEFLMARHGQMMSNTAYVPMWMAKKQMADNNSLSNISYVTIPYTDVNDSLPEVKVTDEDIIRYMQKNPSLYQQEEGRTIDYTLFDFKPTEKDSNDVRESLLAKKEEFKNMKDSLAGNYVTSNNTATPFTDQYVRKKDILIKGDSAYVQGNVYGPYLDDQKRYAIAKITAIKLMPDTVSARHILVQTFDPQSQRFLRDDAAARAIMDTVHMLYRSGTVTFDSLARRFSDDGGSKDSGGLYKAIGLNQFVPEFNEFIFTRNVGDTGTVKTTFGYHFIQLTGKRSNESPAYKIAYLTKAIESSQNTRDSVYGEATKFAASARTAAAFDDYFVKNPGKLVKLNSQKEILKGNAGIDGFLRARDLVRWIFKAKLGDVSEPITMDAENKFLVAKLSGINPEGLLNLRTARTNLENIIRNEKKYDYLVKKYGTGASLEELATKTGKPVTVKDSLSFESATIPGLATEPRVAGASLNPAYQAKVSGPIKGNSGVFYIKVNGQPYARPAAMSDATLVRQQMQMEARRNAFSNESPFRRGAKIKDKRLEVGY